MGEGVEMDSFVRKRWDLVPNFETLSKMYVM